MVARTLGNINIPPLELALADLEAAGAALSAAIRQHLEDEFECVDMREGGINALIGSPNPMTGGKPHTYTSAETAVKLAEPWRQARRDVINAEAHIEDCRARFIRAEIMARIAADEPREIKATAPAGPFQ